MTTPDHRRSKAADYRRVRRRGTGSTLLPRSLVALGRHEAAVVLLEQAGEIDAGAVAVWRPDDLPPDGQPAGLRPRRRHCRGQIEKAGIAGPEQLVGGRHILAVHLDRALIALARLIVRKGSGGSGGAEQEIVILEERGPGEGDRGPRLVEGKPIPGVHRIGERRVR